MEAELAVEEKENHRFVKAGGASGASTFELNFAVKGARFTNPAKFLITRVFV